MSITHTETGILLEGVCLTDGPDMNGEVVDLAGVDLSGIVGDGLFPLTAEFDDTHIVGWARVRQTGDGKAIHASATMLRRADPPPSLDRMYLAPAGIVLERDGQTVKRLKLTGIGVVAQHADPNVPPIGEGPR